jgi:hypothetical protein
MGFSEPIKGDILIQLVGKIENQQSNKKGFPSKDRGFQKMPSGCGDRSKR